MTLHILPLLDGNEVRARRDDSLSGYVVNGRFRFLRKIGAGTYGLIYLMEDSETGKTYAAKMILTELPPTRGNATQNKQFIRDQLLLYFSTHDPVQANDLDLEKVADSGIKCLFLREISLHLRVHKHPNVASIFKVLMLDKFAVITLMDHFDQGDLFANIIDNHLFTRPPVHQNQQLLMKNCMLQLVDVVAYCASQAVYHCDLKPENIMVTYDPNYVRSDSDQNCIVDHKELHITLIDFGLAITSNVICCNACRGLSFYMAPERVVNFNTNSLVRSLVDMDEFVTDPDSLLELTRKFLPTLPGDVWSLGVLFINIACARNPWPVANISDRHEVFANYMLQNRTLLRKILPISVQFNALLDDIFQLNPSKRISLEELAQRVAEVDLFGDKPQENPQLLTPPTEPRTPKTNSIEIRPGKRPAFTKWI